MRDRNGFYDEPYGQSWTEDLAVKLNKLRERVHSSKTRSAYKRIRFYPENYLTEDDYVESAVIDLRLYSKAAITLKNTHATNSLTFTIEACIDPRDWHTLKAATALAATVQAFEYISESWAYARIKVKSTVGSTPATLLAFVGAKSK